MKNITRIPPIEKKKSSPNLAQQVKFLENYEVPLSLAVKCGNLLFVSGIAPIDPKTSELVKGDIEKQTKVVLENLKSVLEASGSSMSKVLKTTIFSTNAAFFNRINDIYGKYFKNNYPARTFVNVGSFPLEFDIEIECVAFTE